MDIDKSVYTYEFDKFTEHLHDYFGDEFGKEHIKYLSEFLMNQAAFYESELEDYDTLEIYNDYRE